MKVTKKKPNIELAKALIECQPQTIVYKPHPKLKDHVQSFRLKVTIDENANRIIENGKPIATFRPCTEGEKPDRMIFSQNEGRVVGFKEIMK